MTRIGRKILSGREDTRIYYSHTRLTDEACLAEAGVGTINPFQEPVDCPVAQSIIDIPGVVDVTLKPYSAAVQKAPTWEWSEIEPSLLRLFTSLNLEEGALMSLPEEGL